MEHRSDVEIHGQESCEETIFILDWLFLKQHGRYCCRKMAVVGGLNSIKDTVQISRL